METDTEKIFSSMNHTLDELQKELRPHGSYESWYDSLQNFREDINRKYIKLCSPWGTYRYKLTIQPSGQLIDHHIISYLAPLDFKRKGWGGVKLSPVQHLSQLGNFFKRRRIRFIYVPLPNKGTIYPKLITRIPINAPYNAPQWRKYIKELIEADMEVIDTFPLFTAGCSKKDKEDYGLFSFGHHISSKGAKLTAGIIAEYLHKTTYGIDPVFQLTEKQEVVNYRDKDYPTESGQYRERLYMCQYSGNGKNLPYSNQDSMDSPIAVIGDCNLQNYMEYGAGVTANLAQQLKFPVHNVGRYLPFSCEDPVDKKVLDLLLKKEIVIYVAFASAGFVRTSLLSYRNLGKFMSWSTWDITNE